MEVEVLNCTKCKNKKPLHVGDRVSFGGDKAEHSLEYLSKAAELKGIRPHSVSRHTIMLVTKSAGERSKTVTSARKLGVPVIGHEEFELLLKSVCPGDWPIPRKPPFSSLIIEGARVYELGLNPQQRKELEDYLHGYGAKLAIQMKDSVAAVVTSNLLSNSGKVKAFHRLGVPNYLFSRIKLH
jgi:hypothetical protein